MSVNATVANATAITDGTRGWVRQSNDRGSLDIIISCFITIFLCIWTSVCINVPSPEHGVRAILRDRWHMCCLGLLGPEFVLLCAVGQYCSARASVQAFASTNHEGWTMRHAFFADMGGIHLRFPDVVSFPVNAKQLHFLVKNDFIPYPRITMDEINDRNKADGLARVICTIQIFWFTLSTVSRPIARYAMTTLELTTLAYILCALAILFFWRDKPMDIRTPMVLECANAMSQIAERWGHIATQPYHYTPLDFVSREEWIASRLWVYYVNLLRQMHVVHSYKRTLPVRNFSSINFLMLTRPMIFVMLAISFVYTGIFVAGWNLHFPSRAEQLLWRICTVGTLILTVMGGVFEGTMTLLQLQRRYTVSALVSGSDVEAVMHPPSHGRQQSREPTRTDIILQKIRNNTPDKDPHLDLPIRSLMITTPICALYCIFRGFILVEDIISLRRLPASAFAAIDWSTYVPHI